MAWRESICISIVDISWRNRDAEKFSNYAAVVISYLEMLLNLNGGTEEQRRVQVIL